MVRGLFLPLEDRWAARGYRPRYVTFGSFDPKSYYDLFASHADALARFVAVNTPASTAANLAFTFRYNEDYPHPVTPNEAPGMGYDAFYLAAYAAFAAGEQPLTGANLARAIRRLVPPGTHVDVGASGILRAFSILRSGANIDLDGTVTTLDFDFGTGDAKVDFAVYCPRRDNAGKSVVGVESGLVYEAASGHIAGTNHCPGTH
jgi:ABC-type branched-subunit amino acid transport system substrate-binding protein